MPDPAFRSLSAETEDVRWASVDQIRHRARRRTVGRAATVAGALAVVLVSGSVAVAQVVRDPAPPVATAPPPVRPSPLPPSASVSPSPSAERPAPPPPPPSSADDPPEAGVTRAMMLRPQDVGAGYVVQSGSGGDWTFEFNASVLDCPRGSRPDPLATRDRRLRKGQPQDEDVVLQQTGRFAPGAAARYLDGIRQRVSRCSPPDGRSVTVAARGFAGDDSLLVVFDHGAGRPAKLVLVREGDVLTEIYSKRVRSDAANRELGRRAAARL